MYLKSWTGLVKKLGQKRSIWDEKRNTSFQHQKRLMRDYRGITQLGQRLSDKRYNYDTDLVDTWDIMKTM